MTISALAVTILLVLVAAVFVTVLVLVPVSIRITLQVLDTAMEGCLSVTWCGAGFCLATGDAGRTLSVILAGRTCFPLPLAVFTARPGERGGGEPAGRPQNAFFTRILQQAPEILPVVTRLLQDITLKWCSGTFRIGLGSAADTGRLFGYYAAIRPVLLASRRFSFSLVPVFDRQVLEGKIVVDLTFSRPFMHGVWLFRLFRLMETRQATVHHPGGIAAV